MCRILLRKENQIVRGTGGLNPASLLSKRIMRAWLAENPQREAVYMQPFLIWFKYGNFVSEFGRYNRFHRFAVSGN